MKKNPFLGRSISTVGDLSKDELFYLFEQTRILKKAWIEDDEETLDKFRINNPKIGMYEIFTEGSTRTLESFRNAAEFHKINYKIFDVEHSSLKTKNESYAHTINMLMGYNNNQLFVLRTKEEGVCRWLKLAADKYTKRNRIRFIPPVVINGGDGKHKHPTQLILDFFTFLEDNDWESDYIHLALIGDLKYGRTVHSYADGLKIFGKVKIDLIAPKELSMPDVYMEKMKINDFEVQTFGSIQEYIEQNNIANKWYFTRPQRERMDADTKAKMNQLQPLISFDRAFVSKVPEGKVKFYHPLPINKDNPVIPSWVDETKYNGYEEQSANGFLTRIILLAAAGGIIGNENFGEIYKQPEYVEDFIKNEEIKNKSPKKIKTGIIPIPDGVVIDHICRGDNINELGDYVTTVRKVMGIKNNYSGGVGQSRKEKIDKGFLFLPDYKITESEIKKLAAVAPGCTLNIIEKGKIIKKLRLSMPPRIYGINQLKCKNPDCITNFEAVPREFIRHKSNSESIFICAYCDWPHTYKEIWI